MTLDNNYNSMKALEIINKELDKENKVLKNRCFALTHGTMCFFCPLNCEHRSKAFRKDKEQQGEKHDEDGLF